MTAAASMIMALAACEENGGKEALDPVLNLSEKVIQATADGGVYELACSIDNPVEGAVLDLAPDSEWISAWEFTGEKLSVTVDPNYDNADRNAVIAVTYTYGEGLVLEDQISVHQVYQYDYNLEAKFLDAGGYFTGRSGNEPDWCFYLSDLGMNADGGMQANATYYRLDICAGVAPEDYTDIFLPEGTYSLSDNIMSGSFFGVVNADVTEYTELADLEEGTLTVTRNGENYVYEAVLTDENGKVHHVLYTGPVSMDLYSYEGYQIINQDITMENIKLASNVSYTGRSGDVMALTWSLAATPESGDYPFTILAIEMYAPYDQYKLIPGTYRIGSDFSANTMYPGYIDASSGYAFGTYAQYLPGPGYAVLALISDGTLEVAEDADGIYTIDINLKTAEGFTLSGRYVGEIEIPNIPGSGFSTLTGDYYVDLSEATEFTTFNGDGMFSIQLTGPFESDPESLLTQGTGDYVNIEIKADVDYNSETEFGAENGIPGGTYTVAADSENPQPGEFVPGYQSEVGQGLPYGTYWTGAYEAGYISESAPAVDGGLEITNNGDGTYFIEFDFIDDIGYHWYGEWSGALSIYNFDFNFDWAPAAPGVDRPERRLAPVKTAGEDKAGTALQNFRTLPSLR